MKTKVIAFRVTEQEYDAIAFQAQRSKLSTSDWVRATVDLQVYMRELETERKRLERAAKRDAKKAEANVIE